MKNLNYKKEWCSVCNGFGRIQISPDDIVVGMYGKIVNCPLCDGRGELRILTEEEVES